MAQAGYAVAAYREGGMWHCDALPSGVLHDLGVPLAALRSQPPEGGPFVVACVDDEFFLIARSHGPRIDLLLSDLTASVEFPLAAQVLERLGEDSAGGRRARRGLADRRAGPVQRPGVG